MLPAKIRLTMVAVGVAAMLIGGATAALGAGGAERDVVLPLPDDAPPKVEDEKEPFCYFLKPSDAIGFKDCPENTQVTWDGAFNVGFGEFDLSVGRPLRQVRKRVKTLLKGHLPVIEYSFTRDGVVYSVQAFATPIGLDPRNNLVNFIRVKMRNPGKEKVAAALGMAFAKRHGRGRTPLGCATWWRDKFMDKKIFDSSRQIEVSDGKAWRNKHLVFTYTNPEHVEVVSGLAGEILCPMAAYRFELAPRATKTVEFKVPYVPVSAERAGQIEAVLNAGYDDYLNRTIEFWEAVLAGGARFSVPEKKVTDTMKASLIYELIARDTDADGNIFVQERHTQMYFQHEYSEYIANSYDQLGQHKIARETIDHFVHQLPSRGEWGHPLWAAAAHYRMTGDAEFARKIAPVLVPYVEKFKKACATDELGLWPKAGRYCDAVFSAMRSKRGHCTGHSFWILAGLKGAVDLAKAAGREKEAEDYQKLHDEYRGRFLKHLKAVTDKTSGYILPALDNPDEGRDWANYSAGIYPFGVLAPDDPRVRTTLKTVRDYRYREGVITYGRRTSWVKTKKRDLSKIRPGWLHHYVGLMYTTQGLLVLDEQQQVLEDFYSALAHTGSTHAGFEFGIKPWKSRDPAEKTPLGPRNMPPPHGLFAASYNILLRNMLVREDLYNTNVLHLASALSPEWVMPGREIVVENAPTDFGPLSYTVKSTESGAEVSIDARWRKAPEKLLFHVPWFQEISSVRADGKTLKVEQGAIRLPKGVRKVSLRWSWKEKPELSYRKAVELYREKYWLIREGKAPKDMDYRTIFPRRQ